MSDTLPRIEAVAARLVVAVHDRDAEEVAKALNGLRLTQVKALAIALAGGIDPSQPFVVRPPTADVGGVLTSVAEAFGVSVPQMLSPDRSSAPCSARAVASYVLTQRARIGYSETGRLLHRDHSTVMYAVSRVGENAHLRAVADRIWPSERANEE